MSHYRNQHLHNFQQWYVQNEPALSENWERQQRTSGCADFFEFAAREHEEQQQIRVADDCGLVCV